MELLLDNNTPTPHFTFENTKHKLGVRIWGNIESFHTLHELLGGCWDCESEEMTNKENSSHIGVISYFSYEIRHAFMGHRRVRMDGKVVVQWTDDLSEAFEKEEGRVEVGMEFSWPHMLFIMAAWWECLKHKDCPTRTSSILHEFTKSIEQLFQQRSKTQYTCIEPYIHGAIYTGNPYLMQTMEYININFLKWGTLGNVSVEKLSEMMRPSAYGTWQYDNFQATLKKQAKKLGCEIEDLEEEGDRLLYEMEL